MQVLSLTMGAIVGLSLGLTGGGGSLIAVPLLVYGLRLPARDAVGVSLAAVGVTAMVGFAHRWYLGQVDIRTGLGFAMAGMMGAPLGARLARLLPETTLLLAFAGIMILVAVRFWQQSSNQGMTDRSCPVPTSGPAPACQRDSQGTLLLNSKCACMLFLVGLMTGVFSGLFGVGGGFIIVPALVFYSRMSIQTAVGTSLMIIALVSASGIVSHQGDGYPLLTTVTIGFTLGGVIGLFLGQQIAQRIPSQLLERVFSILILAVATFVIVRNVMS